MIVWTVLKILENVETGARLSWAQWGRHSPVLPKGAVAAGESYVARRRVDMNPGPTLGLRHNVGHFDPKEGLGRVLVIEGTGSVCTLLNLHCILVENRIKINDILVSMPNIEF